MKNNIPCMVLRGVLSDQVAVHPIAGHEQWPNAAERVNKRAVRPGRDVHGEVSIIEQKGTVQSRPIHLKDGENAANQRERPEPEFGACLLLPGAAILSFLKLFHFHLTSFVGCWSFPLLSV